MQNWKIKDLILKGKNIINPSFAVTTKDKKHAKQIIENYLSGHQDYFKCTYFNYWALAFHHAHDQAMQELYTAKKEG